MFFVGAVAAFAQQQPAPAQQQIPPVQQQVAPAQQPPAAVPISPSSSAQQSAAVSKAAPGAARAVTPAPTPVTSTNVSLSKKAYEAGLRAVAANDLTGAYGHFAEAVTLDPGNKNARLQRDNIGFRLMQQHQDTAERDAVADHFPKAESELRAAIRLNPTDPIVRERLAQMEQLANTPQDVTQLAGNPHLQPKLGTHTFDFRGDTRGAYAELAKQFGIAVGFEQDLPSAQVRFQLPNADFNTAIATLSLQTHTFWVPLDRHSIFVADDTPQKRTQYTPEIVRTFVLNESSTEAELTDTVRAIREVGGIQKTSLDIGTHTLTVRDTPQRVALAKTMIEDLERARGELVLEIELLELDRTAALNTGLSLPTSASIHSLNSQEVQAAQQATTNEQLIAILQQIFGPNTTTIPPLVLLGGGKSTFLGVPPSNVAANFGQTLNVVRSARRMFLRAKDGQPASFFIGERFPVDLSLLSASLGTTTANSNPLSLSPPTRTDLATGTKPSAVLATSLTGTSVLDLVVANTSDNTLSIFLGNGDGTFAAPTTVAVGNGPVALLAGDFNIDGKTDVAVVNQTDATVEILLGNGDGTFTVGQTYAIGNGATAIVGADFNNDGFTDLVIANETDNTLSLLFGNGDGTFKIGTPIPVLGAPIALAKTDFNNDGNADLAVVTNSTKQVLILLGNGNGTFTEKSALTTGNGPSAITTGDFNGDGVIDFAVTNSTDSTVNVFFGAGDGTFPTETSLPTGANPVAIVAGDFTGDGIADLLTANNSASTVSLLIGDGKGNFSTNIDIAVAAGPVALAAGDFNGDTLNDVAVAAQTANAVSILINTNLASSVNGASTPEVGYPAASYEDIGIKVKTTPRVHTNEEVTLQFAFDITSLAGTAVNGIPVIGNRSVQQTVRLKENEMSIISGLLNRQETRAISGLPGLAQTGLLANIIAGANNTASDTELIIAITPRLIHRAPSGGHTVYAGRGNEVTAH
jgi:hypothetical protein